MTDYPKNYDGYDYDPYVDYDDLKLKEDYVRQGGVVNQEVAPSGDSIITITGHDNNVKYNEDVGNLLKIRKQLRLSREHFDRNFVIGDYLSWAKYVSDLLLKDSNRSLNIYANKNNPKAITQIIILDNQTHKIIYMCREPKILLVFQDMYDSMLDPLNIAEIENSFGLK